MCLLSRPGKSYPTSQVATNVEVKCGNFTFVEHFIMCKMDGINLFLGNTFFETYRVNIKRLSTLKVATNVEIGELKLVITKWLTLSRSQLNLVSMANLRDYRFLF